MEKIREKAPGLISSEHQRLLAITRMHGARRRVEAKLRECAPGILCSVSTIDGFALSILNRWRTVLGWSKPIHSVSTVADFGETLFAIEADFERVQAAATRLLQYTTVKRIISATYPLIAVDEFQDCHGSLLEFIKALSSCSTLLLAADEFQLLDTSVSGCPAVEWAKDLRIDQCAEIAELTVCRRTSAHGILEAARCLRDNIQATARTVPVVCCPREAPAAWKIIDSLVFNKNRWIGTTALICPSHDPFIQKVLNSCDAQLQKKNCKPIQWNVEYTSDNEQKRIRTGLGITDETGKDNDEWVLPQSMLDPISAHVVNRLQRFVRLKGLKAITRTLLEHHVEIVVHEKRSYRNHNALRTVTTVHGAKNREFDNVFVLWTYKLAPDKDWQRRLLYNAITRAKKNCMILVLGDLARAQNDPVLRLLGPAQPAFSNRVKPKTSTSTKKMANVRVSVTTEQKRDAKD